MSNFLKEMVLSQFMFDRLELSPSLSKYLIAISPILGITGSVENKKFYVLSKYFSLKDDRIVIDFCSDSPPEQLSLNLLRKGEDPILIAVLSNFPIEYKYFKEGRNLPVPIYLNSVISFECTLEEKLEVQDSRIAIYKVVQASGVAGLDPDFNDEITIAKTLEVMTLAAVDTYIINKKAEK